AVHVADAQAVREAIRPRRLLALLADRMHFPRLRRILARSEPCHLTRIAGLVDGHDENTLALAEQIDKLRRLVAGRLVNQMLLPVARLALRVLIPVAWLAGETNDEQVHP